MKPPCRKRPEAEGVEEGGEEAREEGVEEGREQAEPVVREKVQRSSCTELISCSKKGKKSRGKSATIHYFTRLLGIAQIYQLQMIAPDW